MTDPQLSADAVGDQDQRYVPPGGWCTCRKECGDTDVDGPGTCKKGSAVFSGDAVGERPDLLTAETLICCDHAHVADPACGLNGDGIATLGELIAAYDSPGSDAVGEDRPARDSLGGYLWPASGGGVEGDRPTDCAYPDGSCHCPPGHCTFRVSGGGVEGSREDRAPKPNVWTDLYDQDIERLTDERDAAEARVVELEAELDRIRALTTGDPMTIYHEYEQKRLANVELEAALREARRMIPHADVSSTERGQLCARIDAVLAAAGEGEDRR